MAVAARLVRPSEWCCASDESPLFSFVQINDTHVQAPLEKLDKEIDTYPRANEKARWLVDEITRAQQPELVLAMGDLIHGQRLDRLKPDLDCFRELIQPIKCPFYPNLGNHEVVQAEGDPTFEQPYRDLFGADRINYDFEFCGIRFIMLNNSGAPTTKPTVRSARNAWLKEVLSRQTSLPTIIGCHIPLISIREQPKLAASFGFNSYMAHDAELLQIVDGAKSLIAVLSGHLHLTGCAIRKGVRHISIAGTASYPSDFGRYRVFADRIELEVCQLPAELAKSCSSIHGTPRHATGFTDLEHDTPDEYEIGRSDERRISIPLRAERNVS